MTDNPKQPVAEGLEEPQEAVQEPFEYVPQLKGVPYDLIQHFSLEIMDFTPRVQDRLREIYRMLDGKDLAEKFRNLARIERKLGRGVGNIRRYEKVWNWLRLNHGLKVNRSAQERQKALEAS